MRLLIIIDYWIITNMHKHTHTHTQEKVDLFLEDGVALRRAVFLTEHDLTLPHLRIAYR